MKKLTKNFIVITFLCFVIIATGLTALLTKDVQWTIVALCTSTVVYLVLGWYISFLFIEWLKDYTSAHYEVLGNLVKENRIMQVTKNKKHYTFILDHPGESFAYQLTPALIQNVVDAVKKGTMHPFRTYVNDMNPDDRKRLLPVAPFNTDAVEIIGQKVIWKVLEDSYEIVPHPGFKYENRLGGLRKLIYKESSILLYANNWRFQQGIFWDVLDIQYFDEKNNLVTLTPGISPYLFRAYVNYAFMIEGAEDATGNPVHILFTVRARVCNPYYLRIVINNWIQYLRDEALNEGMIQVKKYVFSSIHTYEVDEDGKLAMNKDIEVNEIATIVSGFEASVLKRLQTQLRGFEVEQVNIRNIIPSQKIAAALEGLFENSVESQKIVTLSEAEKVAGLNNNAVLRDLIATAFNGDESMAKMYFLSQMNNLKYLALDGKNSGVVINEN